MPILSLSYPLLISILSLSNPYLIPTSSLPHPRPTQMRAMAATNLAFIYFLEGDYQLAEKQADIAIKADRYNAKVPYLTPYLTPYQTNYLTLFDTLSNPT